MEIVATVRIVWLVWALALLATLFMSAVLSYHWKPHKLYDTHTGRMEKIFYGGCALLLLGSAGLLLLL